MEAGAQPEARVQREQSPRIFLSKECPRVELLGRAATAAMRIHRVSDRPVQMVRQVLMVPEVAAAVVVELAVAVELDLRAVEQAVTVEQVVKARTASSSFGGKFVGNYE